MRPAACATVLAVVLCLLPAGAARAQSPASAEGVSIWQLSLYKTVTFEIAANTADIALFALFFGGGPATAATFFAVNTLTASAAYYTHEVVWDHFAPATEETQVRTALAKTVSYRLVSAVRNLSLGGLFGGSLGGSVGFAAAGQVTDTALYLANEALWAIYGPPIAR